ncbi:Uncharacterised protein [Arthrobacter agilis]|nr:Uncharacterised protein [Arthrobacter agilis]
MEGYRTVAFQLTVRLPETRVLLRSDDCGDPSLQLLKENQ